MCKEMNKSHFVRMDIDTVLEFIKLVIHQVDEIC
jgi:hypothetical protein